jgi:hypothetical protein
VHFDDEEPPEDKEIPKANESWQASSQAYLKDRVIGNMVAARVTAEALHVVGQVVGYVVKETASAVGHAAKETAIVAFGCRGE